MAREIERKFLVRSDDWRRDADAGVRYRQGYISTSPGRVVRVRAADARGWLTLKGMAEGIARDEFEYPIPVADAHEILDRLCRKPIIEKVRYHVAFGGHVWEVDVFEGANTGLVLAELELPSADTPFALPAWAGDEVSGDHRYSNAALVGNPYASWPK